MRLATRSPDVPTDADPTALAAREARVATRRGAIVLTVVAAGLVLLTRVVIVPWIESVDAWVIPQDVWTSLPAARWVASGDVFHLYQPLVGRTGYPYTPGLPILMAPFVAIGDHFHFLGDYFFTHRHPAMFLLLGPAEAAVGMFPILLVTGHAVGGTRRRIWAVQGLVFLVAFWAPGVWFHPEDTIVCALLIAACLRAGTDRDTAGSGAARATDERVWRVVGALIGAALLFKQWALWPAIPILGAAPRGRRSYAAFYAFALPALIMAPFLLAGSGAWSSLVGTRASLTYGQPQLWLNVAFGHQQLANPDLLRLVWGIAAVVIALRVRRAPTVDLLIAGVGTTMLARLLFEPVIFAYYLVPALAIAIIWCARNGQPIALRGLTATLLCAFCMPQTFPQPVFFAILALGLAYVCGPMVEPVFARRTRVVRS